ncbi:hypothetical protein TELCIR_03737 [Teladorsagia circumcincta]|uniref:Uncharacterized protein n=1 Tax=Teladorsagia circumcincta TaxID=45464 RepID=A0A2G9UX23_TELCI|nr:hypothetical protein TELCIR_03737 [Teladorsagia circumcincta]
MRPSVPQSFSTIENQEKIRVTKKKQNTVSESQSKVEPQKTFKITKAVLCKVTESHTQPRQEEEG